MSSPAQTLVIYGDGLAGGMTATALAKSLCDTHRIIYVRSGTSAGSDAFYGNVTGPGAYEFLRMLDLDEPTLFTQTRTSFSLGTHYKDWLGGRTWMQCHAQPFGVMDGVPLIHHLTRSKAPLGAVLAGAQAALAGRFAHPPKDPSIPLSRAEYGYQFSPDEWAGLLHKRLCARKGLETIEADIERIETGEGRLKTLYLTSGASITPDLVIDCSGPARKGIKALGGRYQGERDVAFIQSTSLQLELGPPCRTVSAIHGGWSSTAHLQNEEVKLTLGDPPEDPAQSPGQTIQTGHLNKAWLGNCLAIGQAASVLEPLTPAPMILLQRDIERLLDLIPVSSDMTVERREFNRRFGEDVAHANMFQTGLYLSKDLPGSPYWAGVSAINTPEKLTRKIAQFENRGLLVKYDLEPFNDEDWTIAHTGMGRTPRKYDLQVERIALEQSRRQLEEMSRAIAQFVPRVPPHHLYVVNMKRYFEKQNHA